MNQELIKELESQLMELEHRLDSFLSSLRYNSRGISHMVIVNVESSIEGLKRRISILKEKENEQKN